jgi:hypothetical protein
VTACTISAETEAGVAADWPKGVGGPAPGGGDLRLQALASLPDPQLDGSDIGELADVDWYWVTRAAAEMLAAGADPRFGGEVRLLAEALLGASEAAHASALILEPIRLTRAYGGLYLDGRRRVAAMREQRLERCLISVVEVEAG